MTIYPCVGNKLAVSGKFIKIVRRFFFEKLGIKIAKNAKHKLGKLFSLLNYMFSHNMPAEEACHEMKVDYPDALVASADVLLGRLKTVEKCSIESAFSNTIKHLLKKFIKTDAIVAIDYYDVPYYGNKSNCNVFGSKHQRGTNWCHQYTTLEIVLGEHRLTLAVKKLSVDEYEKAIVIRQLIQKAKEYIRIDLILLDRGFYAIECIKTLKCQYLKFIMPVPRNNSIKTSHEENPTNVSLANPDKPIFFEPTINSTKKLEKFIENFPKEKRERIHRYIKKLFSRMPEN